MTPNRLAKYTKTNDVFAIEWALIHGNYRVRELAAIQLGKVKSQRSMDLLINAVDDNIKKVSLAAINALSNITISESTQEKMKSKIEFWKRRDLELRNKKTRTSANLHLKNERTSKKTFDEIKQQLQRPMNTGKWF